MIKRRIGVPFHVLLSRSTRVFMTRAGGWKAFDMTESAYVEWAWCFQYTHSFEATLVLTSPAAGWIICSCGIQVGRKLPTASADWRIGARLATARAR